MSFLEKSKNVTEIRYSKIVPILYLFFVFLILKYKILFFLFLYDKFPNIIDQNNRIILEKLGFNFDKYSQTFK